MPKNIQLVFPSYLYRGSLGGKAARLNKDFAQEIAALEQIDDAGREWSIENYGNGYSSYSSQCLLHKTSPNFGELEQLLKPHIKAYVKQLKWDLGKRTVAMTTCWANSMGQGTHHTMHTHPLCVISGVYYVNAPKGSSPLKIEDPRMGLLMASPPRKASAPEIEQNYLKIQPKAGDFVLFESWMRHEVPPHRGDQRRLSISFNYELF